MQEPVGRARRHADIVKRFGHLGQCTQTLMRKQLRGRLAFERYHDYAAVDRDHKIQNNRTSHLGKGEVEVEVQSETEST